MELNLDIEVTADYLEDLELMALAAEALDNLDDDEPTDLELISEYDYEDAPF